MVEDAPGLHLLVRAGVLDESGAGHPLARHLLGLPPPSPHAEGEGHEQEVDVSVFDLATRMHKLDTCYEWAAESKAHAEDLLFGARPRVIWWWQRSRAQHSYPLEHAFLSADTCVHAFHIERAVCEKLCLILDDRETYNSEMALVLAGKEFPGYAGYPYVHADGGVSPFVQQRRTVRFQGATEINFLLREVQEISGTWCRPCGMRLDCPYPTAACCSHAAKRSRRCTSCCRIRRSRRPSRGITTRRTSS